MDEYYNIWRVDEERWTNATHPTFGQQDPRTPFNLTYEQAQKWLDDRFTTLVQYEVRPINSNDEKQKDRLAREAWADKYL